MGTLEYIQEVTQIFKDYYGDDKVMLRENPEYPHNQEIIVYWPAVVVTNENGGSETIFDLFAQVPLKEDGKHLREKFKLMRTTYTLRQARSGYTHSHISSTTSLGTWGSPCLGTGPINNTIHTLQNDPCSFDELRTFWELFCRELDDYTQVESLRGGPYIRLETIGANTRRDKTRNFLNGTDNTLKWQVVPTARRLLRSGKLKFSYHHHHFDLGMSDTDFAMLATKAAWEIYASQGNTIEKFIVDFNCNTHILSQGRLCATSEGRGSAYNPERVGEEIIVFNGISFKLSVIGDLGNNINQLLIMDDGYLGSLKTYILHLVNATYGKRNITEDAIFI